MARQNWIFDNVDGALFSLCHMVLQDGDTFASRAGSTLDVTHIGVTLEKPWQREILNPARKHNLAAQIAETMWVLSGRDDVEWLERYLPRARDFSDDGEVWRGAYGKRIRRWPRPEVRLGYVDQLDHVVRLLKEDPNTRRAVISIYDPAIDSDPGKDIPCNDFLTFSIRNGELDLGVTIRSNDLMWGWSGINAFEWSALQEIVAGLVGVAVGSLHFGITSLHLYERHWERARNICDSAAGTPSRWRSAPGFQMDSFFRSVSQLDVLFEKWFQLEDKIRGGGFVDRQVDEFPEPLLRSWLRVLQWWWSGDEAYLLPLAGTRLEASARVAVKPPKQGPPPPGTPEDEAFSSYVTSLHDEKDAAYGDSWKRRGEMLGILSNIARKIDRLGSHTPTSDESSADTAIDLLVYLAKYRWWLTEVSGAPAPLSGTWAEPDRTERVNALIYKTTGERGPRNQQALEIHLTELFAQLEQAVTEGRAERYEIVDRMLPKSRHLASLLWKREKWMASNAKRSWNPE